MQASQSYAIAANSLILATPANLVGLHQLKGIHMASSVEKKVKLRVSRCLDQIIELRGSGLSSDESVLLERCVEIARRFQSSIGDAFSPPVAALVAARQPVARPPVQAISPAPVAAPAPAVALPKDLVPEDPYDAPRDHHWHGQSGEPPAQRQHMPKEPRRDYRCATELARTDLDSHIVPLIEEADDKF